MRSNRSIILRGFLKEHNKFLNLENLLKKINPGTIVKYYGGTTNIAVEDINFLSKIGITPQAPQLSLFNHNYNLGSVDFAENHFGNNQIHAEYSLKNSNSFALSTFEEQETFITPQDILVAMKKKNYNREAWRSEYKGCAIVLGTISANGLTYVSAKNSGFSLKAGCKLVLDGTATTQVPQPKLHVANPDLQFSISHSSSVSDNAIAKSGTTPFFVLYTPRFDKETGELKAMLPYGRDF